MAAKGDDYTDGGYVKGLFRDRRSAEGAFQAARELGYTEADISVIMADETRERLFAGKSATELERKAGGSGGSNDPDTAADEVGGPMGATVATIAPALAAIGTVLLVPGIIALGPIAVALAAAGAMGAAAGLVGLLTRWGIPSERVQEYEAAIRDGGILIAVKPQSAPAAQRLVQAWTAVGGESVHS